jgi:hypothetical protein
MSGLRHLEIPGLVFEIHCESPYEVVEASACYADFVGGGPIKTGAKRVPVELRILDTVPEPAGARVFDSGESWLAYGSDDDLIFAFPATDDPGNFWWTARLEREVPRVTVDFAPEIIERTETTTRIFNPLRYPLDQLLTMFLLSPLRRCIVHAAGVARSGRGIACIGRSGAGKTTLMGLLANTEPSLRLSDDRVILEAGPTPTISGTPWAGEGMVATNATADLVAMVFLQQGEGHELRAISSAEAAARLLPTTSVPWFDEGAMTGCLATLDELVRTIPAYDLFFALDIGVAGTLRQLI